MRCSDVIQCLGTGLDYKVESLPDTITWPKVEKMREVWREVMRMAESSNRRIRVELLKE